MRVPLPSPYPLRPRARIPPLAKDPKERYEGNGTVGEDNARKTIRHEWKRAPIAERLGVDLTTAQLSRSPKGHFLDARGLMTTALARFPPWLVSRYFTQCFVWICPWALLLSRDGVTQSFVLLNYAPGVTFF